MSAQGGGDGVGRNDSLDMTLDSITSFATETKSRGGGLLGSLGLTPTPHQEMEGPRIAYLVLHINPLLNTTESDERLARESTNSRSQSRSVASESSSIMQSAFV